MTNETVQTIYLRKNERGMIAPLNPSQVPNDQDYKYEIKTVVDGSDKQVSILLGGIAGARYYEEDRVNPLMNQPGYLLKEPSNQHDSKAIAIYRLNWYGKSIRVGYVVSAISNAVYPYLSDKTMVRLDLVRDEVSYFRAK